MTLQEKLNALKASFAGKLSSQARDTMQRATDELIASGAVERALKLGSQAPVFVLKDLEGIDVSSAALLEEGPLIVSFYRGVWCPYCNLDLQALQAALPEFERRGARLICISPQTAVNSKKAVRQNNLTFPILCDDQNQVADAFGIKFALPDYLADLYKSFGNNLAVVNNDPCWTLPMPARYVIARDNTIVYAEVNPDYTHRPEPESLFPAIEQAAKLR
jgi:peroxiredoxin